MIPNVNVSSEMLWTGSLSKPVLDNVFLRQHKSMVWVDYPSHMADIER